MTWFDRVDTGTHCAKARPNARETAMAPEQPTPSTPARRAAILVAEDDAASGQYFRDALEACGWDVSVERDGDLALDLASRRHFDVLLLDCHMPGAAAVQILAALRSDARAASHASAAIATSAELPPRQRRQLEDAGFAGTVAKPVGVQQLQATVRALLPADADAPGDLLDDRAALRSSGSPDAVRALRELFARELRGLTDELDALVREPAQLAARLHRLLASCGFCGAHALADASLRLKQQVAQGAVPVADEVERFRQTLASTLDALARSPSPDSANGSAGPRD